MLRTIGLLVVGGAVGILGAVAVLTLVAADRVPESTLPWSFRLILLALAAVALTYPIVRVAMWWHAGRSVAASRRRFAGALLAFWAAATTVAVMLPLVEAIGLSYIRTVKTLDLAVLAQTVQAYTARAGTPPREWRDVAELVRTARLRGESLEGFAADRELLERARSGDRVYTYVRQGDEGWRIEIGHRDLCGDLELLMRMLRESSPPPPRCGIVDFYPYFYRRALTGEP